MKYDDLMDVLHGTAAGLHKAGVMDLTTMRELDALSEVYNQNLLFKPRSDHVANLPSESQWNTTDLD